MRRLWMTTALVLLSACSAVRRSAVRPDYATADRTTTLRLVVVVSPLPGGELALGDLFGRIARKYVNDKRDFIVKSAAAAEREPEGACGEGVDGLLRLVPKVARAGGGVEAEVAGELVRCRDRSVVWSAEAGGTWPSEDSLYVATADHYVGILGEPVRPYVGPVFRLLQATLDTLPVPQLPDDAAKMEKIELDE
jgi:probable lipoprotein (TIGR04455 family)